jgi:hypothetical protein
MSNHMKKMTEVELAILKSLIGQNFQFVGGPEAPSYLVSDRFLVGGAGWCISISGDIDFADLGDESGEYSYLVVRAASQLEVEKTVESGNVYLTNRSGLILDVSILAETLTQRKGETSVWLHEVDVAVLLRLASGYVILKLLSHNMEAILVEFVEEFSIAKVEPPSNSFVNDDLVSYNSSLRIIDLARIE